MPVVFGVTAGQRAIMPLLVDVSGRPLVTIDTALPAGSNLIGRVDARGGDKILSYATRISEQQSNLNAAAGLNTLQSTAVPAGKIWHLQQLAIANDTSASGQALVYIVAGGVAVVLLRVAALAAGVWQTFSHAGLVMAQGDRINTDFAGCVAGDDIYMRFIAREENI